MLCSAAATFTASINCRKELNTAKTRTLSSAGCVCGKPTAEPGRGNGKSSNPAIQSLSTAQHLNLCKFAEYLSRFLRVQCPRLNKPRLLVGRTGFLEGDFQNTESRSFDLLTVRLGIA